MARGKQTKQTPTVASAPPTDSGSATSDDEGLQKSCRRRGKCKSKKTTTINSDLTQLVNDLRSEVDRQKSVISTLTTRLNFVLSMFGADVSVCDDASARESNSKLLPDQSTVSASNCKVTDGTTSVASSQLASRQTSPQDSFRGAVLTAVYTDLKRQEHRAKNFVVSGLPCIPDSEDKYAVTQLCQNELNIVPEVLQCKRLGKPIPGRVQPLLVSVRSAEQASAVISASRTLRKSSNIDVRNVFINPDLTKAQATAAYQLRCQRRQAMKRPSNSANVQTDSSLSTGTAMHSFLNTSAAEFIPAPTAGTL
jgi:hypothetical protein